MNNASINNKQDILTEKEKMYTISNEEAVFVQMFIQNLKNQIDNDKYPTKQDLLNEIKNNERFINIAESNESYYSEILKYYDTYEEKNERNIWQGLQEQIRENDAKLATMQDENGNFHTIQNDLSSSSLQEEFNDEINKQIAKGANAPTSAQDAFEVARKKIKVEEVFLPANQINKTSILVQSLIRYFEDEKITDVMFSENGLARDRDGNLYEAIADSSGKVTIQKLTTTTYENSSSQTEPATVMTYYEKENSFSPFDMAMLTALYTSENYIEQIRQLNLPPEQEQALIQDVQAHQERSFSENNKELNNAPKVFKLTKKDQNHGFLNIVLLSTITLLFGILCTLYVFVNIVI